MGNGAVSIDHLPFLSVFLSAAAVRAGAPLSHSSPDAVTLHNTMVRSLVLRLSCMKSPLSKDSVLLSPRKQRISISAFSRTHLHTEV